MTFYVFCEVAHVFSNTNCSSYFCRNTIAHRQSILAVFVIELSVDRAVAYCLA